MVPLAGWCWDEVADAIAAGLQRASADLELEQAVRGLDGLAELELHPLLHAALRAAGHGVRAEVRFPRARDRRRRTEGSRCDIVLTPQAAPLAEADAQVDLFAPAGATGAEDAAWIEVKVVAQHREGGPHRGYAHALQHPVWRDVEKLAGDPQIRHAAVVLILFTADAEIAAHDLGVWAARASMQGLDLLPRVTRTIEIGDRLGNRVCTLALFPLLRRHG